MTGSLKVTFIVALGDTPTFGSVAGDLGFSELTIAAMLGHAAQTVTQGYIHVDEALRLAVARTSEEIFAILNRGAARAG